MKTRKTKARLIVSLLRQARTLCHIFICTSDALHTAEYIAIVVYISPHARTNRIYMYNIQHTWRQASFARIKFRFIKAAGGEKRKEIAETHTTR